MSYYAWILPSTSKHYFSSIFLIKKNHESRNFEIFTRFQGFKVDVTINHRQVVNMYNVGAENLACSSREKKTSKMVSEGSKLEIDIETSHMSSQFHHS